MLEYSKQKVNYNKPYKEPLEYYNRYTKERIFHPDTQALIEKYLHFIDEEGINFFCSFIKLLHREEKKNYERKKVKPSKF